ncbi:MAG: ribonuclease E inhibitor RraB [bacterium]
MFSFDFLKFNQKPPVINQAVLNDEVRANLEQMGDDGSQERHVVHYAYSNGPMMPDDRAQAEHWLSQMNFRVKNTANGNGLMFETEQAVCGDIFDQQTIKIRAFFEEIGWDYDGWECIVVRPER